MFNFAKLVFNMKKLLIVFATLTAVSSIEAQTYTHAQALVKITAAGIGISSSGGCSNRNDPSCTSLEQIRQKTIDSGVLVLKQASQCAIIITGGTEVGHSSSTTYSHYNGYKLDYRLNTCLNNYIYNHYTYEGVRSDGAALYKSAAGNIYALEGNHWDVTYY